MSPQRNGFSFRLSLWEYGDAIRGAPEPEMIASFNDGVLYHGFGGWTLRHRHDKESTISKSNRVNDWRQSARQGRYAECDIPSTSVGRKNARRLADEFVPVDDC